MSSPSTACQAEKRNRTIRQAVMTSLLSKFGTVILRIVSIPVAIRVLGMEEFGVYAAIMVIAGLIDTLHVGIGPALTRGISRAIADGDRGRERGFFTTAVLMCTGLTLLAGGIGFLVVMFTPIPVLFGEKFEPFADSMQRACLIAIVLVSIEIICVTCEKARDGYMETRYNNAWGAAGNFAGAAGLVIGVWFFPTIEFLVLAINGSLALSKLGNTLHLLKQRPYLWPHLRRFRKSFVKPLIGDGVRFTVTYSLSALIEYSIVAYVVGRLAGPAAAGIYAAMVILHFSMTGFIQMLTIPTWPALMDAHSRGDLDWIRRAANRLRLIGPAFALCAGLGLVVLGPWALPLWAGEEFHLERSGIIAFAAYFFLHIWRHVNQLLVIGIGRINTSVWTITAESFLVLGLTFAAADSGAGVEGVYAAIAISLALVTGWIFPLTFHREFKRLELAAGGNQETHDPKLAPAGATATAE